MINKNASIYELKENVLLHLKFNRINSALNVIHDAVEKVVTEPVCTSLVIGSSLLDNLCILVGRANLKIDTESSHLRFHTTSTNNKPIVYIVTRLQNSGGHTKLLFDFIKNQPNKTHIIFETGLISGTESQVLDRLKNQHYSNVILYSAPKGNLKSRLTWLQSSLIENHPEHVYLFNHHQDCVAVSALLPELGLKASFCHHGDHHLCLGVHLDHLTHIDLHPMGYHYCRDELGIQNQYLPLTFEDNGLSTFKSSPFGELGLVTATAARSNKVEIPYYVSYLDLIPRVLKATGGKHIHIGKLTPWGLRRIRSQMRKLGLSADRLVYVEWTPSVWKSLQEYGVDLYLASFPYGAGLTLIEALGAGIPVVMHNHIYSRVLSGLELAYPEAFHWSDPEKLLNHLAVLKREDLEAERVLARKHYESFHRQELLKEYLQDSDKWELAVPPLAKDFKPRWDEWAAWAESQLSISKLLYRLVYRTARKLRAFINQRVIG